MDILCYQPFGCWQRRFLLGSLPSSVLDNIYHENYKTLVSAMLINNVLYEQYLYFYVVELFDGKKKMIVVTDTLHPARDSAYVKMGLDPFTLRFRVLFYVDNVAKTAMPWTLFN